MTKDQIPEGASGLKRALEVHARILGLALSNDTIPGRPTQHVMNQFAQRLQTTNSLDTLLKGIGELGNSRAAEEALKKLRESTKTLASTVARDIKSVPDSAIRMMFGALHCFGLSTWSPDFTSTPSSLYNSGLESIFISTFEQAVISFAYRKFEFDPALIKNTRLIRNLYLNFVWSHWFKLSEKEDRTPGSIEKDALLVQVYKRRKELTRKRATYLREHQYNRRIQMLANTPDCTSDDERDPSPRQPGFRIFPKPARNPLVTKLFRDIDAARCEEELGILRPGRRYRKPEPRTEYPPTTNRQSLLLPRVPEMCPLDWFDPDWFNKRPIRFRGDYIDAEIALPLPHVYSGSIQDWKTMSKSAFMKKYGNQVRAQYQLPTEAELNELDNDSDEEDSDEPLESGSRQEEPSAREAMEQDDDL